jgi:hypothetical protein
MLSSNQDSVFGVVLLPSQLNPETSTDFHDDRF